MKSFRLLTLVALSCITTPVFADQRCGSGYVAGHSYSYCAELSPGASGELVYLHGNGGSEKSWRAVDHTALEAAVKKIGATLPTVLTVSFGNSWFLSNANELDAFLAAVAQAEKSLGLKPMERKLMGESMGGFNALELYFLRPRMFSRFAANCAAVLSFAPDAEDEEVYAYLARHAPFVITKLVTKWQSKMQTAFPSPAAWNAGNPVRLAATAAPSSPRLFMTSDGHDAFGFNEGVDLIGASLTRRKAPLEFHSIPAGNHCDYDAASLLALAAFVGEKE